MPKMIFVSSVQSEFAEERAAIRDFVRADALLSKHFDVFLFEDQPAQSRGPVDLYLQEVDLCDAYIVLIGRRYGFEDEEGVSPTEREFERAVFRRKHRLAFVRFDTDADREPKEVAFLQKVERQVKRSKFAAVGDLTGQVYASLIRFLKTSRC